MLKPPPEWVWTMDPAVRAKSPVVTGSQMCFEIFLVDFAVAGHLLEKIFLWVTHEGPLK